MSVDVEYGNSQFTQVAELVDAPVEQRYNWKTRHRKEGYQLPGLMCLYRFESCPEYIKINNYEHN